MKIGAQLYTVREFCETAADLEKCLKDLKAMGYSCVQYSPWKDIGAENILKASQNAGIPVELTHYPPDKLRDDPEAAMAAHRVLGLNMIGIGAMPTEYRANKEMLLKFIEDYKPVVKKLNDNGFRFMYHNHDFEFEKYDGKLAIDYILEAFGPEQMGVILDLYWVQAAGADPAQWLTRLKGRVEAVHFKDLCIINKVPKPVEVMEGNMNWTTIFAAAKEAGVKWAFVEQDESNGKCPMDCMKTSINNLKKAGIA